MKKFLSFAGTGKIHVFLMASALVFGAAMLSCTKEQQAGTGGLTGGESTFRIAFDAGSFAGTPIDGGEMDGMTSKTIPATGMHEDEIANIWVLQFDASGGCVRSKYYGSYDPNNFAVTLSNGTAQTVAFVANTFDATLFDGYAGSWSAFQAAAKTGLTEATVHTGAGAADRYLIISGIYKGDITAAGLPAAVQMKRAVAKIKFTWSIDLPTGESFVAKKMQVCNAATVQAYLEPASDLYPAAGTAGNFAAYAATNNPAAGTYSWYVGENRRGTGTGSTSFDKNAATAQSGQGDYCTYIDVQGTYTFADRQTADLSYKFYLGADVVADYNVRRNNIYDLTVRIVGANAADTRISITSAGGVLDVDVENTGNGGGNVKFD